MLHVVLMRGSYPDWLPYIGNRPFLFFKPVFNLADVAITTGVLNIIFFQRAFFLGEPKAETNEKETIDKVGEENISSSEEGSRISEEDIENKIL